MLFALFLLASAADLVPMRWQSSDPKSLELLKGTPVNCLLLERTLWSKDFLTAAKTAGITTLGVIRPGDSTADAPTDGILLEGDFADPVKAPLVIHLPSRARMRFDAKPVVGTFQGVWPGIQADEGGTAKAAPSGAPWINTNGGFLRFVKAAAPGSTVWLANTPPK